MERVERKKVEALAGRMASLVADLFDLARGDGVLPQATLIQEPFVSRSGREELLQKLQQEVAAIHRDIDTLTKRLDELENRQGVVRPNPVPYPGGPRVEEDNPAEEEYDQGFADGNRAGFAAIVDGINLELEILEQTRGPNFQGSYVTALTNVRNAIMARQ